MTYPHLFQPGRLGTLEIPNRLLLAPMGTGYADQEGCVTDRLVAFHVARAAGGVGLNITEHTAVAPGGLTAPNMLALYDDSHLPGFRTLCRAVHEAGGRIAVQLNHSGRQADPSVVRELVGPSEFRLPGDDDGPAARALTVEEIGELIGRYAAAAARAKYAGADGVELHLAHGYLGASFLSPLTNRRTDEYGGDTDRRCRFAREILAAVRRLCGPDFPVWCRISADELVPGGLALDEAVRVAPILEAAGAQALHVSVCLGQTARFASAPYYLPPGHLAHLAEALKRSVRVPVIAVGRITHPSLAEDLLARGACDFVALGRALLADPDWPNKSADGRPEDICPCIACNIGCLQRRMDPAGVCFCTTNPRTGREFAWPGAPPTAQPPRRLLVIGGGPAGMAAATVLAEAEHEVELWEAADQLGGNYRLACVPPGKGDLRPFLDFQARRLAQSGATVRLGATATAENVLLLAPEAVILATGAEEPPVSVFPGSGAGGAVRADDVLAGLADVGERVVVVGGGRTGLETAHFLADQGRAVTVVETRRQMGDEIPSSVRAFLFEQLDALNVTRLTDTEALHLGEEGLVVMSDDRWQDLVADTVVLALPRRSRAWLAEDIHRGGVKYIRVVGDARAPRSAQEAVYEGTHAALDLIVQLNTQQP